MVGFQMVVDFSRGNESPPISHLLVQRLRNIQAYQFVLVLCEGSSGSFLIWQQVGLTGDLCKFRSSEVVTFGDETEM